MAGSSIILRLRVGGLLGAFLLRSEMHNGGGFMGKIDLSILELACFRIAKEQRIKGFELPHAKVFLGLCDGKKQSPEEIANNAGISREQAFEALDVLIANKLLSYDGNRYFAADALQAINRLIDMAEAEQIKQPIMQMQKEAELLEEYA